MARISRWQAPIAALLWIVAAAGARADTQLTSVLHPAGACAAASGGTDAGARNWTNASNARIADNSRADTATLFTDADAMAPWDANSGSVYLSCDTFGFAVPAGCTIDGIAMQTEHRHGLAVDKIGDRHVYIVRPDGSAIGSTGAASDRQKDCATNDWGAGGGTFDGVANYGGPTDNWGIPAGTKWDACVSTQSDCDPGAATAYNVNRANFGVAVAAQNCGTSGAVASVDSIGLQVTYTIPSCGGQAWGVPNVTVLDKTPGVATRYTIVATVPNRGGCALTAGSVVSITFKSDTNATGATTGSFRETGGTAQPITPTPPPPPPAPQTVTFTVPAGALRPCEGQAQGCLEQNTSVTIVLNGVRNPSVDNKYTLDISATNTLDGSTGTTTSDLFTIAADCTAASPWGTPTVMLSDAQASVPAAGPTLACPIFAKYTIDTSVPPLGGCKLIGGTSKLIVQFPTGTNADSVRITDAKINMTSITPEATGDVTLVSLPVPMDIGNGQSVKIELTVVQNPVATGAKPLSVHATSPFFSSTGSTGTTTNATAYTISAQTTCPPLDFYVRDWTDIPNTKHDDAAIPSSPNSTGNTIPPNCWAKCSDVWNQGGPNPPSIGFDSFYAGTDPGLAGSNNAFTRVSRKTAAPAIPIYRPVTATYFYSAYGLGLNFQPLGSVTTQFVSSSDQTTILAPLTNWTIPERTDMPGTLPAAGEHVCIAVQIDAATDPQKTAGLTTSDIPGPADPLISGDDNKALHNLNVANMAAPPPAPPPPPPPPMGSGPMMQFGIAHNAGLKTRDMVIRYDASREVLQHLRDPAVHVVGGETPPVRPGGTFTLTKMRPGESRWIGFDYTLVSGTEDELQTVTFSEVDGDKVVGAFSFGIQPSPIHVVARKNLEMHGGVFARMARVFGVTQAREESAAARALLKEHCDTEEHYVSHLRKHQRSIDACVSRLLKAERTDPFGVAGALKTFDESLRSGGIAQVATGHLALLEKVDAFQTMLDMAKGDPADVLQMVWWQKELYTTVPQLRELYVSADVVRESEQFIRAYGRAKPGAYPQHIAKLLKSFRATAEALKKSGVDVSAELAQLQRPTKSIAALQKAHRDYLLKLDDLAGSPTSQKRS